MVEIFPYIPQTVAASQTLPNVPTSWNGIEKILPDIISHFKLETRLAIEFGVWHGFSTAALANNFEKVIGVDTFEGDLLAGTTAPMMETTSKTLEPWANIELVKAKYQDFFTLNPYRDLYPSLIHIDIIHTYEDTFACGAIALTRSPCVIFHDTMSFPEVKRAVCDLAQMFGLKFWNYFACEGLGILARPDCSSALFSAAWEKVYNINDRYSLSRNEVEFIISTAEKLPDHPVLLELGVCHGRTFAALAVAAMAKDGEAFGIDDFRLEGTASKVKETLNSRGIGNYTLLVSDTHEYAWEKPIDLLVIDAGHDEPNVKRDIEKYLPFVKSGGYVFFDGYDDPKNLQSPHWAVRYYADIACSQWTDLGIADRRMRAWRKP